MYFPLPQSYRKRFLYTIMYQFGIDGIDTEGIGCRGSDKVIAIFRALLKRFVSGSGKDKCF